MPSAYSQLSNKRGVWVNLFVYYMKKCVEGVQHLGKKSEDYWNRVLPNQKSPYLQRARSQGFKRLNAKFSICSSVNFSFAQNLGKQ